MAKAKGGFKPEDLKRLYFWIVLPLILVLAIAFTFVVKSKIKKAYVEKTSAITAAKQGVDEVASNSKHPNDTTIDGIKAETGVLSKNVFNAWELMYSDQKERNRWPSQLSREFRDLVENKLKFRDPIGVGKPYLLEDYGFFIANHLPDLLKEMNRRRCQVKEYKLLKKNEMSALGITGLNEQFWPVYVASDAEGNRITYLAIYSDPENEKSPIKDVYRYDVKPDVNDCLVSAIDDSALRDQLKAITDPEPYWRDVDPWIMEPKQLIMYGVNDSDLQSIMQAISSAGAEGGAAGGGAGGMSSMGGMSASPMMGPGGGSGGPGGGSGSGMGENGARGAMGEGGGLAGLGIGAIPGDGYDPAVMQVAGTSLEDLAGGLSGGMNGGMNGAGGGMNGMMGGRGAGGGMGPTTMGGGMTGGRGARAGGLGSSNMAGGTGGAGGMGGMGGGATAVEDPSWSQRFFPGLPPYKERRRIVGNVDWPEPEIYSLPTWDANANPTSIEVWYAQETLRSAYQRYRGYELGERRIRRQYRKSAG